MKGKKPSNRDNSSFHSHLKTSLAISLLALVMLVGYFYMFPQQDSIGGMAATGTEKMSFVPSQIDKLVGETFEVELKVENVADAKSIIAVIDYDNTSLEFVRPDMGEFVQPSMLNQYWDDQRLFIALPTDLVTGSGVFGKLTFKTLKESTTVLGFTNDSVITDNDTNSINPVLVNATITIRTTAPETFSITDIAATQITKNSSVITWKTNVSTSTILEYGIDTNYGSNKIDSSMLTDHSITLNGLASNTTYHYRINATTASGTSKLSSDQTFTTLAPTATVPLQTARLSFNPDQLVKNYSLADINFDVMITNATNLKTVIFDLNYGTKLTFKTFVIGPFPKGTVQMNCQPLDNSTPGIVKNINCTRSYDSGVNGSGKFATFTFTPKSAGNSTLSFSNAELIMLNGSNLPLTTGTAALVINSPGCLDDDNDTYNMSGSCPNADDCDDTNPNIYTGATELCNTVDDNCDGVVDEGCSCQDNTTRNCSVNVGTCVMGVQTCLDGNWTECNGTFPGNETCNNLDDDCDGTVDNNLEVKKCSLIEGVCTGTTQSCVNGSWAACTVATYGPNYETEESKCDGLDNDCDGSADNFPSSMACPLTEGVCAGTTKSCDGMLGWSACDKTTYGGNYQRIETACDTLDNDCDGDVDEMCQTTTTTGGNGRGPPPVPPPRPGDIPKTNGTVQQPGTVTGGEGSVGGGTAYTIIWILLGLVIAGAIIYFAYSRFHTQDAAVEPSVSDMVRLRDYVADMLVQGSNYSTLRMAFVDKGWDDKVINEIFKGAFALNQKKRLQGPQMNQNLHKQVVTKMRKNISAQNKEDKAYKPSAPPAPPPKKLDEMDQMIDSMKDVGVDGFVSMEKDLKNIKKEFKADDKKLKIKKEVIKK